MDITGVEFVIFGVEDMDACGRFCLDYGLAEIGAPDGGRRFEALDGSAVELRRVDDPSLPPALASGSTNRLIVWGVKDRATLDAVRAELSKDREVSGDDLLLTTDHDGQAIGFRVSQRKRGDVPPAPANTPGHTNRPVNVPTDFTTGGPPIALGHIVLWTDDCVAATDFYVRRLGFHITDVLGSKEQPFGIFSRAAGHSEHHSVFLLNSRGKFPKGMQHIEFQFRDFREVLVNGGKMTEQGWKTHLGISRHLLGGNWSWYFYSPLGCLFEISSDMDHADENWAPRYVMPQDNKGFQLAWNMVMEKISF